MTATTTIVGAAPGSTIPPSSRVRVTFDGSTVLGYAESFFEGNSYARNFYDLLASQLPVRSIGYVATPLEAVPDASVFTVDLRTGSDYPARTAAELASQLDDISPYWDVSRLELLQVTAGSDTDVADRQAATDQAAAQPTMIEKIVSAAQGVGRWFLWVLALLVVLVLVYLFHK